MAHARIRVTLPEGQWKGDVTREFPETGIHLQSTESTNGDTTEVAVLSGNRKSSCRRAIQTHPHVTDSARIQQSDQEIILQVETSNPRLLTAANRSTTPISYPVEIHDGRAIVDIIGTHESITEFGAQLSEADLAFDVSYLQRDHEIGRVLTCRQQEFVHAAVDLGYYETPRQCSLTDLANEMGVAKSTCSEILHRAEQALVEFFLTHHSTSERGESAYGPSVRDSFLEGQPESS